MKVLCGIMILLTICASCATRETRLNGDINALVRDLNQRTDGSFIAVSSGQLNGYAFPGAPSNDRLYVYPRPDDGTSPNNGRSPGVFYIESDRAPITINENPNVICMDNQDEISSTLVFNSQRTNNPDPTSIVLNLAVDGRDNNAADIDIYNNGLIRPLRAPSDTTAHLALRIRNGKIYQRQINSVVSGFDREVPILDFPMSEATNRNKIGQTLIITLDSREISNGEGGCTVSLLGSGQEPATLARNFCNARNAERVDIAISSRSDPISRPQSGSRTAPKTCIASANVSTRRER